MGLSDECVAMSPLDVDRYLKTRRLGTLARTGFAEGALGNYGVKLEVGPIEVGHDYSEDNKTLEAFLDDYQSLMERYGVKFSGKLSVPD